VAAAVDDLLRPWDGLRALIQPGQFVLIKPNMLAGARPEEGVTAHPALVRELTRRVLSLGARAVVGDSPSREKMPAAARRSGLADALADLRVDIIDLDDPVEAWNPPPTRIKRFRVSRKAVEADVIINIAKLKTHAQMYLTLGVKNMFGCVCGMEKAIWHAKAGHDRDQFATMLLEVYRYLRPALTILDGIQGMDGKGPAGGRVRQLGLLAASADAVALDRVICEIIGAQPSKLRTCALAAELNAGQADLNHIPIIGQSIASLKVPDFQILPMRHLGFGRIPRAIAAAARNALSDRPAVNPHACIRCGACVDHCPVRAMQLTGSAADGGRIVIDYRACIRCYCCLEICPSSAIDVGYGWAYRFFARPGAKLAKAGGK